MIFEQKREETMSAVYSKTPKSRGFPEPSPIAIKREKRARRNALKNMISVASAEALQRLCRGACAEDLTVGLGKRPPKRVEQE